MRRVGEELMKGDDVPRDLIVTIQMHNYSFLHNGNEMQYASIGYSHTHCSNVRGQRFTWNMG